MVRGLTDGEPEIMSELNADADGFGGEEGEDEAAVQAAIYADLDAARDNERRLRERDMSLLRVTGLHGRKTLYGEGA